MQLCRGCEQEKSDEKFYREKGKPSGYSSRCRDCTVRYNKQRRTALRMEALSAYGGKCVNCGEDFPEILVIDHINGGGTRERKKIGGGPNFFFFLKQKQYPSGYQVLCYNCNALKEHCPTKMAEYAKWATTFYR